MSDSLLRPAMTESKVSVEAAREALDSLDDYARMGVGVDAHAPRGMLERFITQQAELIDAVAEKFAADDDKHARGYRTVGMELRSMTADARLRAALAACAPAKSEGR